jgi:hypothetical protein
MTEHSGGHFDKSSFVISDRDMQEFELLYGKLVRQTEEAYYFQGHCEFGICIPKWVCWEIRNEDDTTQDV